MAESSVPGAVGDLRSRIEQARATLAGLSLPLGSTREVAQHERDTAIALIDEALSGGAVGEREELLDVERLRKAWYGHEDTHPGLPCVAVKCVEEVAFAYSKGK